MSALLVLNAILQLGSLRASRYCTGALAASFCVCLDSTAIVVIKSIKCLECAVLCIEDNEADAADRQREAIQY